MIPQLICLTLILLLALLRIPRALRRPQARPTWWATIAGTVSLTTYGIPIPVQLYDRLLGGQNVLTLVRDLAAVAALWFLREALAGYSRAATRYASPRRLAATLIGVTGLFLLIQHRAPTSGTVVMDQIAQPASWLYGTAYMGALTWILIDSARLTARGGRGVVRIITFGAALTGLGCVTEIVVLTAAHFRWGGTVFRDTYAEISAAPFFAGLAIMLLGISGATVVLPLRRRFLVRRVHQIGQRQRLSARHVPLTLAVLGTEKQIVARTHHLLVVLGNAQHAGEFVPTPTETAVISRAEALFRPDTDFRPTVVGKAA